MTEYPETKLHSPKDEQQVNIAAIGVLREVLIVILIKQMSTSNA